jgi:hypothetical protein
MATAVGVRVMQSMCSELLPKDDSATRTTVEPILDGIEKSPPSHLVSHSIVSSTTPTRWQRKSDPAVST